MSPQTEPVQISTVPDPVKNAGESIVGILIASKRLTDTQLRYARRVQSKLVNPKTLLNVLRDLEYVTDAQLNEAVSSLQSPIELGDLLVELGKITHAQLEAAIAMQLEDASKTVGDILVEKGFVDDHALAETMSMQTGLPRVEVRAADVDKSLVTKEMLRSCADNGFFPVRREGGRIQVAFCDPHQPMSRASAERLWGRYLVPAIATRREIHDAVMFYELALRPRPAATSNDSAVVRAINTMITDALRDEASGIHIEPMADRVRVRFRCDGVMSAYKDLPKDLAPALGTRIKTLAKTDAVDKSRHQEIRLRYEDQEIGQPIDLLAAFYVTINGEKIVLKLPSKKRKPLDLEELGMTATMLERFRDEGIDSPGVVIVTGPADSGKTTTLYSCVNYLNDPETNITTVEDPVEFAIDGVTQCAVNAKLNLTLEESLQHLMRQDSDVVVLGDMSDRLAADTGLQAALTGRKVLATLHAEDALGALMRLIYMDLNTHLISSTLSCVVAQRLVRRICPSCVEPYMATAADHRRLGYAPAALNSVPFKQGRGCSDCRSTGYRGRVSVFELLVINDDLKDALMSRQPVQEIRRIALETAMAGTLLEDGLVKAARGVTSLGEVIAHLPRFHKPRSIQELRRLAGEE